MNQQYKIAYATGSRADYGIVRQYLKYLNYNSDIQLEILTTGALLNNDFGYQIELIYADGFKVGAELEVPLNSQNNAGVLHTMAVVLDKFGTLFEEKKYDLLIILGDRYEIFSIAIAAAMQRIPILHIHGGEATYGNYDEFIRHSITKMARFHFTATEEYRKRVIQLGEEPKTVFCLGALGAENSLNIDEDNIPDKIKNLKEREYFVVLFHPETLTSIDPNKQVQELLAAIELMSDKTFVFIGSNADTYSERIRYAVHNYVKGHKNSMYFENLHTDAFHYLVKKSICLMGNSSSGIIEAPSLGVPTINIGNRQKGRTKGNSIIDVCCLKDDIYQAMVNVLHEGNYTDIYNPYYQNNTAKRYYDKTLYILENLSREIEDGAKAFYDICHCQGEL